MNLPDKKSFEANKNDVFEIVFEGETKQPCLIEEINSTMVPVNGTKVEQFSIIFSNTNPNVFNQGVYPISHPSLGDFELFLVPVFGDEKGVHYEAVFT